MVCDECNKYFGDNLELYLARDTLEGEFRYDYNIKNPNEFKTVGKKSRLITTVAEGPFKGAYAYRIYSQEEGKITLVPVPQIGFLKRNSTEYKFFLLDQIPQKNSLEENSFNLDHPQGIIMFGDIKSAKKILNEKGFTFKFGGIIDPPKDFSKELLCYREVEYDTVIFRAIAKIAFNYLAYWEGYNFVFHRDFDPIREYIRKGKKTDYPLLVMRNEAILADEPIEGKRRLGHIVTVNWAADKISIIAQVSLLNWMTYRISIARKFSGERRDIKRGNFFDFPNHEILEIGTK